MSHKEGTYLGGIRSVGDMRVRCIVDVCSGCWEWVGAMCGGAPKLHFWHPITGKRVTGKGRRVALMLARGKDLPKGHVAWQKACCTSRRCLNPEHARSGTKKEWGAWLASTDRVKNLPSKCEGARRAWDKRGRKITPDGVKMIFHSGKSTRELAEELGVSQYAIWSVRNNRGHLPTMRNATVFAWMP